MKKLCFILTIALILFVVSIPKINVSANNVIEPVVSTDNVGNIFYNDEAAVIQFTYPNINDSEISATASYQMYRIDENNVPQIYGDPVVKNLSIAQDETATHSVALAANEFGLYKVVVTLTGDVTGTYGTEFSKSARSANLNYRLGAHETLKSNSKDIMGRKLDLMANAGLGLVRTDFPWPGYESWDTENSFDINGENLDEILTETAKRDLNLMPILGKSHPLYITGGKTEFDARDGSVFLTAEQIDKYARYVETLVNEPLFKAANIDKIEVVNEPDLVNWYEQSDITDNYVLKGQLMAGIYKTAYDTIKAADPDIKVGIGSLSGNWYNDNVKTFVDSVLSEFNGSKYFDALTVHPYAAMLNSGYGENPEDNINTYNDYYKNLLNDGQNSAEMWHTEFGWSAPGHTTEYMQGVYIIRQYVTSLAHSNSDKFYIYNMVNSGTNESDKGQNFGLVRNGDNAVPYAAKFAYLQLANLNRLTADKDKCELVNSANDSYIAKFSSEWTDSQVYMLWSTSDSGSVNYNLDSDKIFYYDILGNLVAESAVKNDDGTYKLTNIPFYILTGAELSDEDEVVGLPVDRVVVDAETSRVTLSGYLGEEGIPVTIMVLKPDADKNNPVDEELVYVNQRITGENGYYEFAFIDSNPEAGDYLIRYNIGEGGSEQSYTYSQTVTVPTITILSGGSKVRSIDEIITDELTLNINMPKAVDTEVICGQYKDGMLVEATMNTMTDTVFSMDFDYLGSGKADAIKVYLWEPATYSPRINAYKIN